MFFACLASTWAQATPAGYGHPATLAFAVEYSGNSNHLILARAYNRRLAGVSLSYSRLLLSSRLLAWSYDLELRPATFLEDPVSTTTQVVQFTNSPPLGPFVVQSGPIQERCQSAVILNPEGTSPNYTVTETRTCGSRWTYTGGLSPLGQRINLFPRSRVQPYLLGNAGFLVAARDIPANDTSSFNFDFTFGAGLQITRDATHAWSVDYRVHHLSNGYIGNNNPGIDSQILHVSYLFPARRGLRSH